MPPVRDALSDTSREYAIVRARLIASATLIVVLLATLVYRYYDLQVSHYAQYLTQSDNNRIRIQTVAPGCLGTQRCAATRARGTASAASHASC